jgi:hypothetical protein
VVLPERDGLLRFCFQCAKLEPLSAFHGSKRWEQHRQQQQQQQQQQQPVSGSGCTAATTSMQQRLHSSNWGIPAMARNAALQYVLL